MSESHRPSLFVEHKRLEAILKNKSNTTFWEEKKKAYEEVKKNLEHYAGKLQEQVMVPIGKRGLIKGRIINTNQVFVSLGGGWFVKTCSPEAQKVCTRRISECRDMLEKLEKERKLFEGWTAFSDKQVFGMDDVNEIIEPYDEKEEESWRKQHAEKVKEQRKKLAEVRKELEDSRSKEKSSEEELWRHLDLLELQEEFEDELDRIGENSESESENSLLLDSDDDSVEEQDDSTLQEQYKVVENKPKTGLQSILSKNQQNSDNKRKLNSSNETKRISFADLNENSTQVRNSISEAENIPVGQIKEHCIDNQQNSHETCSRLVSKFKSSRQKK